MTDERYQQKISITMKEYLQMKSQIQQLKLSNASLIQSNQAFKKQNQKLINFDEEIHQLKTKIKYLSSKSITLAIDKINQQARQEEKVSPVSSQIQQEFLNREKELVSCNKILEQSLKRKKEEYLQKMTQKGKQNELLKAEIRRLKKQLDEKTQKYENQKKKNSELVQDNQRVQKSYEKTLDELNKRQMNHAQ